MTKCAAKNCKNKSRAGLHLFRFPSRKKYSKRLDAWIQNVGGHVCQEDKVYRLCEAHFEKKYIKRVNKRVRLTAEAVPTLKLFNCNSVNVTPVSFTKEVYLDHKYSKGMIIKQDPKDKIITFQENKIRLLSLKLKKKYDKLRKANRELAKMRNEKNKMRLRLKTIFAEDELTKLMNGSLRGHRWTNRTIQKALQMRFTCKNLGYKHLLKIKYPHPSYSSINQHIQDFKFSTGISENVLRLMKSKAIAMTPQDKMCALVIDEMTIKEGEEYYRHTDEFVGKITIPKESKELANHAVAYVLRGLTSKWKQTVGFDFTGYSTDGKVMKDVIYKIIKKYSEIGIEVICVCSDMGGNNTKLWNEIKLNKCRRNEHPVITSIPHPYIADKRLFFSPDVPHIIKNFRNYMIGGQIINLPKETVQKYHLPSGIVDISYIKIIQEYDKKNPNGYKICPKLTDAHFQPTHWKKMDVRLAAQVIASRNVADGLNYAVKQGLIAEEGATTAWFVSKLDRWFDCMTDKVKGIVIGNEEEKFLKEMMEITRKMKISEPGCRSVWKPAQRGILMATQTVLDLLNYLTSEMQYKYFLPGRLTSDCVENLFSLVRQANPVPSCREFCIIMRMLILSQYLNTPATGSYTIDDSDYLINFLDDKENKPIQMSKPIIELSQCEKIEPEVKDSQWEINAALFHNFCGSVARKVVQQLNCDNCMDVLNAGVPYLPEHEYTQIREHVAETPDLIYLKREVLDFFQHCESVFQLNKEKFKSDCKIRKQLIEMFEKLPCHIVPSPCHTILTKKLCVQFANSRIYIYENNLKRESRISRKARLTAVMGAHKHV